MTQFNLIIRKQRSKKYMVRVVGGRIYGPFRSMTGVMRCIETTEHEIEAKKRQLLGKTAT